jgi:hypothetical protein
VEVEENYTGELIIAREKINEIQNRLAQADERVRSSSTAYTSAKYLPVNNNKYLM